MGYLDQHYNWLVLWHPETLVLVILLTVLYFQVTSPDALGARWGFSRPSAGQVRFWLAAMLMDYLAMGSPLATVADGYLYVAHMLQVTILTMIVPPLIWASLPADVIETLLNRPWAARLFRIWGHPLLALVIFNVLTWIWDYPPILDKTLQVSVLFVIGNYIMLIAGLFLWWPVMAPRAQNISGRRGFRELLTPPAGVAISAEAQMLYLFFNFDLMMPPTIFIADTTKPFYAFYEQAPHVFGLGALADQQTGALLMGVAMFLAYAIAFGAAFRRYDFSSWYA